MDKKSAKDRPKSGNRGGTNPNGVEKSLVVEAGSIVVFAFAVFLLVALATYSPQDPSFFTTTTESVSNSCGRVGAYVAALFFQTVGIAAFLIPAALLFVASSIFKREGGLRVVGTLSGMTVAVLSLTVFLTIQWKYWPYAGSLLLTGGAFGVWFSQILVHQFNTLGSSLVSLLVFSLAVALSTPLSVAQAGGRVLGWGKVFVQRVLWRVVKVGATYLSFLLGLLAMKLAQAAARGIENAIDGVIARAKEARKAYEERQAAKAAEEAEGARLAAAKPRIGSDGEADGEAEALAAAGADGIAVLPATEKVPLKLGETDVPMAANVLPPKADKSTVQQVREDLAKANALADEFDGTMDGDTAAAAAPAPGATPAILPHEFQKQNELGLGEIKLETAAPKKTPRAAAKKKSNWKLPSIDYLVRPPKIESEIDKNRLYENASILTQKFLDFEIEGEVTAVRPGPVITLYEFKPAAGVKVSRIAALADDISMALSAQSVRIIAPLPGKSVVGIEIPSDVRENVFMREFIQHPDFNGGKHILPVAMGKDIAGNTYFSDLSKMPHLLCAGQTGSGKSVFMNGLICSLLYRFNPDELRMILVDPKMIEFASYQDIPHLLLPVVDDSSNAAQALKWAVREMERRYRILAMTGARNLASFNTRVDEIGADVLQETLVSADAQTEGMERMSGGDWSEAFEKDEDGNPRYGKLPYIVIVIDELADLMMTAKKEVEISIARIAQKARAAGIHLVIATQRPSTDVVTGIIKANLPSRVSFQLASGVDSKTILDRVGAERLLGRGDMFFVPPGTSNLLRLHGAYLSDDEINKVTAFLKGQGKPVYRNEILEDEDAEGEDGEGAEGADPLFDQAVELVRKKGSASASYLQRHFSIGYNRAARLIESMEERGIVGPPDGARPREVLMR